MRRSEMTNSRSTNGRLRPVSLGRVQHFQRQAEDRIEDGVEYAPRNQQPDHAEAAHLLSERLKAAGGILGKKQPDCAEGPVVEARVGVVLGMRSPVRETAERRVACQSDMFSSTATLLKLNRLPEPTTAPARVAVSTKFRTSSERVTQTFAK